MIEDLWIAALIHAFKQLADVDYTLAKVAQVLDDKDRIVSIDCFDRCQHSLDDGPSSCFHGIRDNEEPGLIIGASYRVKGFHVIRLTLVDISLSWRPVPQVERGIRCDWMHF